MDAELARMVQRDAEGFDSVVELGAMFGEYLHAIRNIVPRRVGVEIYEPYLRYVKDNEARFYCEDAINWCARQKPGSFDLVLLIDVIEHLRKREGDRLLEAAKQVARRRVILYTPEGFRKQTPEESASAVQRVYGVPRMVNEFQKHQSGWTRAELENAEFAISTMMRKMAKRMLYAVWNRDEEEGDDADAG